MWGILSGKKVQKMGGFQVCNEASKAPLARKQTRASVMSSETRWGGVGGHREGRVACCKLELSQNFNMSCPVRHTVAPVQQGMLNEFDNYHSPQTYFVFPATLGLMSQHTYTINGVGSAVTILVNKTVMHNSKPLSALCNHLN